MSDLEPCSRCRLLFAPLALSNGRCLGCREELAELKAFRKFVTYQPLKRKPFRKKKSP